MAVGADQIGHGVWEMADGEIHPSWTEQSIDLLAGPGSGQQVMTVVNAAGGAYGIIKFGQFSLRVLLRKPQPAPLNWANTDFPGIATKVSQQKQFRHVNSRPEYRGGGHFDCADDAQRVLDAFHSGKATIIGHTAQGYPVVRFNGVTGTNVNVGAGFPNQPTNVFIIKGTTHPSVVPTSPAWGG